MAAGMSGTDEVIEITRFKKAGGALTKRITLSSDGALISDGSACLMSHGRAQRVRLADLGDAADLIQSLESNEAIALGSMRRDLSNHVRVVTQNQLRHLNGTKPPPANTICRTSDYILYEAERPALALIDVDTKGMPDTVRTRIKEAGGFWEALVSVVPAMETTGRIVRRSTSTGIIRTDTERRSPDRTGCTSICTFKTAATSSDFFGRCMNGVGLRVSDGTWSAQAGSCSIGRLSIGWSARARDWCSKARPCWCRLLRRTRKPDGQ
jgi:hypothetical protein